MTAPQKTSTRIRPRKTNSRRGAGRHPAATAGDEHTTQGTRALSRSPITITIKLLITIKITTDRGAGTPPLKLSVHVLLGFAHSVVLVHGTLGFRGFWANATAASLEGLRSATAPG